MVESNQLTEEEVEAKEIEEGLRDIKEGRVYSIEEIAKELGIKLK